MGNSNAVDVRAHWWRKLYASKTWHAESAQYIRSGLAMCGQDLRHATHYIPPGNFEAPRMIRACKRCMRKLPAVEVQDA